jgi:hypothetical protein
MSLYAARAAVRRRNPGTSGKAPVQEMASIPPDIPGIDPDKLHRLHRKNRGEYRGFFVVFTTNSTTQ